MKIFCHILPFYYSKRMNCKLKRRTREWLHRLGVVAHSCNPATWRPDVEDDLRTGVLVLSAPRWLGVRTKLGINMGALGEPGAARLAKEGRIGPGGKPSSQKSPCWAVVGSRPGVGAGWQPDQHSQTDIFFFFQTNLVNPPRHQRGWEIPVRYYICEGKLPIVSSFGERTTIKDGYHG